MIGNYSQDCDYLRKRFKLSALTSLYEVVHTTTNYIRQMDEKQELAKASKEISKEKKRGRPRKKSSSN